MTEQDKLDILKRLATLPERDQAKIWRIVRDLIDVFRDFPATRPLP